MVLRFLRVVVLLQLVQELFEPIWRGLFQNALIIGLKSLSELLQDCGLTGTGEAVGADAPACVAVQGP